MGIRQVSSKVLPPVINMTNSDSKQPDSSNFDEFVDELQAMISQRNNELHDARVALQKLQLTISQLNKELDDGRASSFRRSEELEERQSQLVSVLESKKEIEEALAEQSVKLHALLGANGKLREEVERFRSSRWFRLGQALRSARTLRGFVALPIRTARALRTKPRPERPVVASIASHLGLSVDNTAPPSLLALFVTGTPPLSTWEGAESVPSQLEKLRSSPSKEWLNLLVGSSIHRGDEVWVASQLIDWGQSEISAVSPVQIEGLIRALQAAGHVHLPLRLLQLSGKSGEKLRGIREQLERNSEILSNGVSVRIPSVSAASGATEIDSLYLLHNSLPHSSGGYATRTHGLLAGLRDHGRTVVGVTRPGFPNSGKVFQQKDDIEARDVIDGIEYHRSMGEVEALPRSDLSGFVQTYSKMLEPVLSTYRPRIIHGASNWWNGHAAVAISSALSIPSIYEVRGLWEVTRGSRESAWLESDVYNLDSIYERDAAKSADHVITITNGLKEEMIRRGVDPRRITVVPNSVDIERFSTSERDRSVRTKLGWDEKFVIGFVGSVTFYEGLNSLLTAIRMCIDEGVANIRFLLVGDGPALKPLIQQADELGLSEICYFAGRVPHSDVEKYLGAIDVTPFPRLPLPVCEMVSPLKPLESMASRIPVIVSDVAALKEMVPDGCGIVVDKHSASELSVAISRVASDPQLAKSLAENAYEWVRKERSWKRSAGIISDLYSNLLS